MAQLKVINNFKVKPVEESAEVERKKQKGKKLFSLWCPSMYLLAKTGGGKTTVLINVIEQLSGKHTKFIFIVSTINIDPSWKALVKKLGDRCVTYTDIKDDGVNIIEQFLKSQDPEKYGDNESDEEEGQVGSGYTNAPLNDFSFMKKSLPQIGNGNDESESDEEDKWTYPYPKYVLVMDDLGSSMRNKWVTQLLKVNRHYDTMVIASSQDYNDLDKPARKQPRYVLVFKDMSNDKLKELHKDLDLSIDLDKFEERYKIATEGKYNFLYIGRLPSGTEYRKNFNQLFENDEENTTVKSIL